MAEIRLPYVNSFRDPRNGRMRHQFRRKGIRKTLLRGRPGDADFMAHYAKLLAQSENAIALVGASRTKPGTLDEGVVTYLGSDAFKALSPITQARRRRILDDFRAYRTGGGNRYGRNALRTMARRNITDVLAGKPVATQRDWLKAIRGLIAFAINQGIMANDPTVGIKTARPAKSAGYMTWSDEQIAQYRQWHPIGSMARLALELMLNIAARRTDAHQIGRQPLRNGYLSWRPSKTRQSTGKMLTIRVMPELQAALDALPPSDALTLLLTDHGRPFASAAAFGNKFSNWCRAADLKPVLCDDGRVRSFRAHGLRKAACTQLVHAGCTAPEIMAISGHSSLAEVQRYIIAVEQDRLAEAAMAKRSKAVRGSD